MNHTLDDQKSGLQKNMESWLLKLVEDEIHAIKYFSKTKTHSEFVRSVQGELGWLDTFQLNNPRSLSVVRIITRKALRHLLVLNLQQEDTNER